MSQMILGGLSYRPVFVDELPLPYGKNKHPDHEYIEHLLRSIGYIQDFAFNEGERNAGAEDFVASYAIFGAEDDNDSLMLRWKKGKNGEPEFFLEDVSTARIKMVDEETGEIILDDDSVFFRAKLPEPSVIQALNVLEHNKFRLMRISDPTNGYLYMRDSEVIGVYRSRLTHEALAERVLIIEADGKIKLESKGVTNLESFLRNWHTRNFKPPRSEPST